MVEEGREGGFVRSMYKVCEKGGKGESGDIGSYSYHSVLCRRRKKAVSRYTTYYVIVSWLGSDGANWIAKTKWRSPRHL